jgi:heme A synthase
MIVLDRETAHEVSAALKERFWPRFFLVAFCALLSIGSMLPFIILQNEFAVRLLFALVWTLFAIGHLSLTLIVNLWSASWHQGHKYVLYGTHNARGFCKCPLFLFRFATPFLLYILLWIPSILQQYDASAVDARAFAMRNWTVFGVFLGLVALFFGAHVCGGFCMFKRRKQGIVVEDVIVVVEE